MAIYREKVLLGANGKSIKNREEILDLRHAFWNLIYQATREVAQPTLTSTMLLLLPPTLPELPTYLISDDDFFHRWPNGLTKQG